jgi:4-aminobutyrate aminotransferase/(S)-3-amino-2-methylpropionate transaminase
MFASQHYGLEPDLMTMAKSLGAGLPLSAITGRAEVMDSAQVGGLGGTYAGNPVSCAGALAAIAFIEKERLPERAASIGEEVGRRFQCFVDRFPFVGDARGLGAMRALELVKDRDSKEPDKDRTDGVIRKAWESGLLLVGAGTYGNVIRTLMPLVVTDAELTEGLDVLENALAST